MILIETGCVSIIYISVFDSVFGIVAIRNIGVMLAFSGLLGLFLQFFSVFGFLNLSGLLQLSLHVYYQVYFCRSFADLQFYFAFSLRSAAAVLHKFSHNNCNQCSLASPVFITLTVSHVIFTSSRSLGLLE